MVQVYLSDKQGRKAVPQGGNSPLLFHGACERVLEGLGVGHHPNAQRLGGTDPCEMNDGKVESWARQWREMHGQSKERNIGRTQGAGANKRRGWLRRATHYLDKR